MTLYTELAIWKEFRIKYLPSAAVDFKFLSNEKHKCTSLTVIRYINILWTLPDLSLTAFWAAARCGTTAMTTAAMITAAAGGHRDRRRVAIWLRWCDYAVVPGHWADAYFAASVAAAAASVRVPDQLRRVRVR